MRKNFTLAKATAKQILAAAECLAEDMDNAETEDDLFSIRLRAEIINRAIARLESINTATLEGRTFED